MANSFRQKRLIVNFALIRGCRWDVLRANSSSSSQSFLLPPGLNFRLSICILLVSLEHGNVELVARSHDLLECRIERAEPARIVPNFEACAWYESSEQQVDFIPCLMVCGDEYAFAAFGLSE